jgi:hypothetical protein
MWIPFRPTRARAALMLAGLAVVAGAYGLAGLCGRLRADIVRTGSCTVGSVTSTSKEHLTVQLANGGYVGLYGFGLDLSAGAPLFLCVSDGGTWADARGDSSRWLLTSEPATFPAAAGIALVFSGLYVGDGVRIGRRDEE